MTKKKSNPGATSNPGWFREGRSGNPGGRPTGSRAPASSAFDILTEKTIIVTRHGDAREITVEEALQQRTYEDALAGNRMAQREVLKAIGKRDAWQLKHPTKASRPAITCHISPDPDNADAVLLLLGIAAPNPARAEFGKDRAQLLLEPWAVQEALSRRRGGQRLTDRERDEIRRCTRDADRLRWPRGTDE
jgi:Family of unknown function (DUF5681)